MAKCGAVFPRDGNPGLRCAPSGYKCSMLSPSKRAWSHWRLPSTFEVSAHAACDRSRAGIEPAGARCGDWGLGGPGVAAMSLAVAELHTLLFRVPPGSGCPRSPRSTLTWRSRYRRWRLGLRPRRCRARRWRPLREVDPIEANALHGGRMSLIGSLNVALQTVWSSGVGARSDWRPATRSWRAGSPVARPCLSLTAQRSAHPVGCGAAGAIAGAFGAPLGGAFYGFELVIASYSVTSPRAGGACRAGRLSVDQRS